MGENIAIEDIMPGNVASVWADMDEDVIRMQISSNQIVGTLKEKDEEIKELKEEIKRLSIEIYRSLFYHF